MNKKTLSIVLVVAAVGVVYFGYQKGFFGGGVDSGGTIPMGEAVPNGEVNSGTGASQGGKQSAGQKGVFGLAEEIATPAGLPSELKSIFSEACGEVKLTTLNYDFLNKGSDMLVYVWKNKPTEEKLTSAFEKNGYELDGHGEILYLKKGGLYLIVDWASADREEGQEIVVLAAK